MSTIHYLQEVEKDWSKDREKVIPGKCQQQSWCGYINIRQMDFKGKKKVIRTMPASKIGI